MPGKGTTFTASLMLSSSGVVTQRAPERSIAGFKNDPGLVFVVDDDPSHRGIIHELLGSLGFQVIQAQDGNECLDMLKLSQTQPRIFLLDISMPGMSGWELAQQIRTQIPEAAIVMISANANTESPLDPPPNNGYLVKPVKRNDLLALLEDVADVEWLYQDELKERAPTQESKPFAFDEQTRNELISLAQIGYANAIRSRLNQLQQALDSDSMGETKQLQELKKLASQFQYSEFIKRLESSYDH